MSTNNHEKNQDRRLLHTVTPRNLLSYGPDTEPIELRALNILIGPNGSGKSNLIEAIALLRAAPADLRDATRKGGGVGEWIWKGRPGSPATIEAIVGYPRGKQDLRHVLAFRAEGQAFHLEDERIENKDPYGNSPRPYLFYDYQQGNPVLNQAKGKQRRLARETVAPDSSILAQFRDPDQYPEITHLGSAYQGIRIYREWTFGRNALYRAPEPADLRNDHLGEDFSNLGLILNRFGKFPEAKDALLTELHRLYEAVRDYEVLVEGGTVQLFLREDKFSIPAPRLSDGTMRYLCLLAILCDPEPSPLICIEEPELGLHPDILPGFADLLVRASKRTQLIVTTHSDILVDAMTQSPEAVIVCEKDGDRSVLRRLKAADLNDWLERYRLGELWTRGHLGGTRW